MNHAHAHALVLDRDRFATLRAAMRIHVTHGSLWLTVDGEPDDLFVDCGQAVELPRGARVLAQAVQGPARAVVLRRVGWRERAHAAWHALTHRAAGAAT